MGREMLFPAIYIHSFGPRVVLLAQTLTTSALETGSEAFARTPGDAQVKLSVKARSEQQDRQTPSCPITVLLPPLCLHISRES